MKRNLYLLVILSFILIIPAKAQVMINEYSCSNLNQFVDNHSDYGDWIELYNSDPSAINIGGFYLSDDSINNMKWQIPSGTMIAGNGFLRFWTSGRDEVSGGHYHTNFKLNQTKNNPEYVVFSTNTGFIFDHIVLDKQTQLGHSRGRTVDGAPTWSFFVNPTPGASNNTQVTYANYADKPDFSVDAGFYSGSVTVSMTTNEPNADIHYTLDGTLPTISSPIYTTPLTVSSTSVVKAITLSTDPEILPSFIRYETYFINVSHSIPVVSIAATSLQTLANGTGNLRPHGTIEYFDTSGARTAKTYGEFNRHGQDSWVLSQRSLDFISRDEMGYNHSIEHKLFNSSDRTNFQRVILRAAGDDNYPADHRPANAGSAHMRDAYIHTLAIDGGMKLDVRRASKCVVYINGDYWGVYDLRENPDEHDFTDYYYGQDKFNLQYIETWGSTWAEYGGAQALSDWNALHTYAMTHSMTNPVDFKYVDDRLDIASLIDYVLVNSFSVCSDWLNYNTGWWRGMDSTGTHLKWGYILWDNDATFGHYINYTGIPNDNFNALPCDVTSGQLSDPEDHIDLLNKLRTNPAVNQYFITRQIDMWNTVFGCDNMLAKFDSMAAVIDPEMAQHSTRWSGTYTEWLTNLQNLRSFIESRCNWMSNGYISCYSLTGPYDITLNTDPPGAGSIQFNTMLLENFPWSGKYFGGIDNILKAFTDTSTYAFVNWTSDSSQTFSPNATSTDVTVNLTSGDSIVAHFTTSVSLPELNASHPQVTAYPSVFSNHLTLEYSLPEAEQVSFRLYSLLGKQVTGINSPETSRTAGNHKVSLDFSNSQLTPGVYLLDFTAGNYRQTIKLIYSK